MPGCRFRAQFQGAHTVHSQHSRPQSPTQMFSHPASGSQRKAAGLAHPGSVGGGVEEEQLAGQAGQQLHARVGKGTARCGPATMASHVGERVALGEALCA